jgi:hypothetical protein
LENAKNILFHAQRGAIQLNMFLNVVFAYGRFTLLLFVALAFHLKFIMLLVMRNMERALYLNLKIKNAMMSSLHHGQ